MGSQALPGIVSFVQYSTDSGVTWSTLSEQKSATLRLTVEKADVTNKTTSVNAQNMIVRERVPVTIDWTATVDANMIDDVDTGQAAFVTAALAGTIILVRFCRKVLTGLSALKGSAIVEFSSNYPMVDASTIQFQLSAAAGTTLSRVTQ